MKIVKGVVLFLCGFTRTNAFLEEFHSKIIPKIFEKNHEIYQHYDKLGDNKKYFQPNIFSLVEKVNELNHKNENIMDMGKENVKMVSSILPKIDSIGGQILHANDVLIDNILNNDNIPHEIQKQIILCFIKFAQYGDEAGSVLLQMYYDFVKNSL